ncbi:TPA: hypothetical protein ACH3X1_005286 [Trebouxia sp. C0004]
MMSRVYLASACLRGKPVSQRAGAALKGLQQLCIWAAQPSEGSKVDSQTTTPDVQSTHQPTSRQGVRKSDVIIPAVHDEQHNMKPAWPDKQQATEAVSFRSAKYMNHYIREQWQLAAQSVRHSSPDKVMEAYYGCLDQICRSSEKQLDSIHISAAVYGTAKVWIAAKTRHSGWCGKQQADQKLRSFIVRMLQRLEPLLPAVSARQAANLLWSSAQLRLNPDALVPGMTDSLAQEFIIDMDAATGQEHANVLVACAKLQLNPCQGGLFKAILYRLATADLSNFQPQGVANTLHSLVTLPAASPSDDVLDALCQRFGVMLQSCQAAELPDAQSIANTMWALSKLKHAPSDELAMSMVGRMVALCRLPGQQPKPQNISNVLLACAELSVPIKQADTDSLASFLLSSTRRQGIWQAYANTAWSLAVTGHLRQTQLALMLDQLAALSINHHELSQSSPLKVAELGQLYQALDWLQPLPIAPAHQQSAWSSLQGKLHTLGPRPSPDKPLFNGLRKLCSALDQLQFPFKAMVVIQSYWVHAVLQSQDNKAQPVILRLFSPDYITNIPGRLTGRTVFKTHLLAKQGRLVDVPQEMTSDIITVKQLADYLEPILTVAAGAPLDTYRL